MAAHVPAATPGTLLGDRFHVTRLIDETPSVRRYLAEDSQAGSGALLVHELLAPDLIAAEDRRLAAGWLDERATRLATVRHPALAPVVAHWGDAGPGAPFYLVHAYVPGPTLAEELADAGPVPWRRAVDWALSLADVLAAAHAVRPPCFHGHVRPAHVTLDSRAGTPVLTDFGLARGVAGRPWDNGGYTPFEQHIGRPTPASDLYALGALLYVSLSGYDPDMALAHLLRRGLDHQRAMRALFPPLDRDALNLPAALSSLLARSLAFIAEDRFPDVHSMADALRTVLGPAVRTSDATPESAPEPVWRRAGLTRAAWFALPTAERNARLLALASRDGTPSPASAPAPVPPIVSAAPSPASPPSARPAPRVDAAPAPAGPPTGAPVLRVDAAGGMEDRLTASTDSTADPYTTIAAALAAAGPGARVEVAAGCYTESLRLDRPVEIVGSGAETVISALAAPCLTIAAAGVVARGLLLSQHGETSAAVICAAPDALLEDCQIVGGTPAALLVPDGGEATMRRCTFQESAEGVRVLAGGSATLEDCAITGSGVAGIRLQGGARARVWRTQVRDGEGAGLVDAGARGTIEDCAIVGNGGHGIILDGGELAITACRVNFNGGAAIAAPRGGATVENCDLSGNAEGAWLLPDDGPPPLLTRRRNRE